MSSNIPKTQYAIELTGPDQMSLNSEKQVHFPGPYQILARIEAVGLCFSDLKLLKQFDRHPRKSGVVSGIDKDVLSEIPCYKPGLMPTVPGHEAVCIIVAVGDKVKHHHPGQRVLVQTDYRWLKTAKSNAAFGYNFEGALQQYALLDERITVDPASNKSFLIPVGRGLSASAIAMVEPWACVESSYISKERKTILKGSNLLIAAEKGRQIRGVTESFSPDGKPVSITVVCVEDSQFEAVKSLGVNTTRISELSRLADESFDDIIYFGSSKEAIEVLNDKLASGGIINIVLGGETIGGEVFVGVGRVHYSITRWVGTAGSDSADSYKTIPNTGDVRDCDKAIVVGAGGPMGQMHTLRIISSGRKNLSVTATDFDDRRLKSLERKVAVLAREHSVELSFINPQENPLTEKFSYSVIMVPLGELVAQAVSNSLDGTLINIFAGIPANVKQDIDLDTYIVNRCYMFGTSGSRLSDMKLVLQKVTSGQLNTDYSVAAVSGMAGVIDGMSAVKERSIAGKIIVYPALENMPLVEISKMKEIYPTVAAKMENVIWNAQAEQELMRVAKDRER